MHDSRRRWRIRHIVVIVINYFVVVITIRLGRRIWVVRRVVFVTGMAMPMRVLVSVVEMRMGMVDVGFTLMVARSMADPTAGVCRH